MAENRAVWEGWGRARQTYPAERIKDVVEVDEYLALGHLGNVVHCLAGIVPHARVLVGEAGEHGWDNNLEVAGKFLAQGKQSGRREQT